jgi:hypothetical protein
MKQGAKEPFTGSFFILGQNENKRKGW